MRMRIKQIKNYVENNCLAPYMRFKIECIKYQVQKLTGTTATVTVLQNLTLFRSPFSRFVDDDC